jgi:hypothetical protein
MDTLRPEKDMLDRVAWVWSECDVVAWRSRKMLESVWSGKLKLQGMGSSLIGYEEENENRVIPRCFSTALYQTSSPTRFSSDWYVPHVLEIKIFFSVYLMKPSHSSVLLHASLHLFTRPPHVFVGIVAYAAIACFALSGVRPPSSFAILAIRRK